MLSRVAENLYWMARYLERTEDTARLINTITTVVLDMPHGTAFGWNMLVKAAGLDQLFSKYYDNAHEDSIMRFLIQDERNPSSIMSCIHLARENTRTFREVLPWEAWEGINGMYLYARAHLRADMSRSARFEVLNAIIYQRQTLVGLLAGSMSRDVAYQFLRLGRNVERADMTSRIIDVTTAVLLPRNAEPATAYLNLLWLSVLRSLSAYQMYRRHVAVQVRPEQALDFLFNDAHFPRTITHCMDEVGECLSMLPKNTDALRALRSVRRHLRNADLTELVVGGLHEFMDEIQADLAALHDALSQQYFYFYRSNAEPPTAMAAGSSQA